MKEEHKIYFRGSLILREQNARYVIFKRKEKKRWLLDWFPHSNWEQIGR